MNYLIWTLIMMIWMVIGYILFVPYAWLAGGAHNMTLSAVMIVVAPVVIIVFFILIIFARRTSNKKEKRGLLTAFWIFLTIVNLPIIVRFISVGLKALKWVAVADFVFKHRFWSILAATFIAVLVTMIRTGKLLKKLDKKPELQN